MIPDDTFVAEEFEAWHAVVCYYYPFSDSDDDEVIAFKISADIVYCWLMLSTLKYLITRQNTVISHSICSI